MAGSFHYMAPERLTGHYSPASDVFSLGVIVLEMLTGKRLAELKTMFSDPSFQEELEKALAASLDEDAAQDSGGSARAGLRSGAPPQTGGREGVDGRTGRRARSDVTLQPVRHPLQAKIVIGANAPHFAALRPAHLLDGQTFHAAQPDRLGHLRVHGAELLEHHLHGQSRSEAGSAAIGRHQQFGNQFDRNPLGGI